MQSWSARGILLAMALHNQNVQPIRDTMLAAGIRLNTLDEIDIRDSLLRTAAVRQGQRASIQ
ncbi:MAG: hypothetical protein HND48_13075 [Chloroflexi bacterium]|nr:hypothetical protein [Chloroflexota bacterium]